MTMHRLVQTFLYWTFSIIAAAWVLVTHNSSTRGAGAFQEDFRDIWTGGLAACADNAANSRLRIFFLIPDDFQQFMRWFGRRMVWQD